VCCESVELELIVSTPAQHSPAVSRAQSRAHTPSGNH
jgi:hypothetical protein